MSHIEFCGYLKGNVQKYVWRYRSKNGIEDLKKALVYLDWLNKEVGNEKTMDVNIGSSCGKAFE
jgi:hypothetical protein